jgi:hypothetical protein
MVGLLLAVGCGGGGGGGLEGEMSKFKDKMCACDNKECADKVHEDYNAWAKGAREEEKKLSKEEREKLKGMDREVKECRRKFRDEDKKNAADPAGSAAAPAAPAGSAATP